MPDIDLDFPPREHPRGADPAAVIEPLTGRNRAALVSSFACYRNAAARCGTSRKALGLPPGEVERAGTLGRSLDLRRDRAATWRRRSRAGWGRGRIEGLRRAWAGARCISCSKGARACRGTCRSNPGGDGDRHRAAVRDLPDPARGDDRAARSSSGTRTRAPTARLPQRSTCSGLGMLSGGRALAWRRSRRVRGGSGSICRGIPFNDRGRVPLDQGGGPPRARSRSRAARADGRCSWQDAGPSSLDDPHGAGSASVRPGARSSAGAVHPYIERRKLLAPPTPDYEVPYEHPSLRNRRCATRSHDRLPGPGGSRRPMAVRPAFLPRARPRGPRRAMSRRALRGGDGAPRYEQKFIAGACR